MLCSAGCSVLLSKVTRAARSHIPCSVTMAAPPGGGKKGVKRKLEAAEVGSTDKSIEESPSEEITDFDEDEIVRLPLVE